MGNSNMQKQLRKILVGGQGSNIELKLQLFDPEFTQTTYTVTTNKKAPFETEMPQINGSTGISTFSSMRVIVDGRNLNIDGLDLIWRGVRLSSGPKLG